MAASFVLHGVLNADLFLQPAVSGEMFIVFAKVHPFLNELREKSGDPQMFGIIEKVIMSSKYGRERFKFTQKRVEMMRERMASAKAG